MKIKTKIGVAIIFVSVSVIVIKTYRNLQRATNISLNSSRLAIIQYAIGGYVSTAKQSAESLSAYIVRKYPQIGVSSNAILDYYKTPVRYVIEKRTDGTLIGVYSAGEDKLWGTTDDMKRESVLINADLGE